MHSLWHMRLSLVAATTLVAAACSPLLSFPSLESEDTGTLCKDGQDNDGDGQTDCDDDDCLGHCKEDSAKRCKDGKDNDGDGIVDYREPSCWPFARIATGLDGALGASTVRCSSVAGTALETDPAEGFTHWWGNGDFGPAPASGSSEPVMVLPATTACTADGDNAACPFLEHVMLLRGGPRLRLELDVWLEDPSAQLGLVLARSDDPGLDEPDGKPLSTSAVSLATTGAGGAELTYRATGHTARTVGGLTPSGRWIRLELAVAPREADDDEQIEATARARWPTGKVLELDADTDGNPLRFPRSWASEPLVVRLAVRGPGAAYVHPRRLERGGHDPCGFHVPQLGEATGPDRHAARIVAAAVAPSTPRYCALGTMNPAARTVEARYDPVAHRGWPPQPELPPEEDPARERRPEAWSSSADEDSAIEAGRLWDRCGERLRLELPQPYLRAASLAWAQDTGGFEGIALVSDAPRIGGTFVRIRSEDCCRWDVVPMPTLERLEKPSREPVSQREGYPFGSDEETWKPDSAVPLRYEVDAATGERRLVAALMDEAGPRLQATGDEHQTGRYPWGSLAIVTWYGPDASSEPDIELAESEACQDLETPNRLCLPSLTRSWSVSNAPPVIEEDFIPAPVHQLVERAGERAYLVTASDGIRFVAHKRDPVADGLGDLGERTDLLIGPSGRAGTFDAAHVTDAHILLPPEGEGAGDLCGILLYRGFHATVREGDRIRRSGGATGVVPVCICAPGTAGPCAPDR